MTRAWLVRMNPVNVDRVKLGLVRNEVTVGWGAAGATLLDPRLDRSQMREVIQRTYRPTTRDYRYSGLAAGQLWRFIREMAPGHLMLVPHGAEVYLAEITGEARYNPTDSAEHHAFSHSVRWAHHGRAIDRARLGDDLRAALRTRMTCVEITAHASELQELMSP